MRGLGLPYSTFWGGCLLLRGVLPVALCPVGCGGDDGKLCFTRGPQQINSSERLCFLGLLGLRTSSSPRRFPPRAVVCLPGASLSSAFG